MKAAEQDTPEVQAARAVFCERMKGLDAGKLVFLDEFGCNTAMTRRYARSLRGQRAYGSAPVNYGPNITVAGAVRLNGLVTAMRLEGAMDGEAFLAFTEGFLAPELSAGDIVIMDNLASHKVTGVVEAIEAVGASVLYLPPYSPDFNPIEMIWAKVKEYLRLQAARTLEALDSALSRAFERITNTDLLGCFKHCGYVQPN